MPNPAPDDWRRQGQEQHLYEVKLVLRDFFPRSPEWDHDHCAFCWTKFSLTENNLRTGYATEDGYHWICEQCVQDFQDEFHWHLIPYDWRRVMQEGYLRGAKLVFRDYPPEEDHHHCEFCRATFSLWGNDLEKGYSTEDSSHWICEQCFNDFRDEFEWQLVQ